MAMLRAMDSAVAGLRSHQNKMDVIGNNIANVNTWGFKSQSYSFKEAMYQTSSASTGGTTTAGGTNAAQYGYGTMMGSITMDMTASTPSYIGGLNATIEGEGFFLTLPTKGADVAIDADADTTTTNIKNANFSYTRVGQFKVDSNGYLVDANGNFVYGFQPADASDSTTIDQTKMVAIRVCDENGTSFTGDPTLASNVQINALGEVTATVTVTVPGVGGAAATKEEKVVTLGKLAIATFQNPEGLTKSGGNYYSASAGDNTGLCSATIPGGATSRLMAGYLESSNVDLAKEFSEMITTQRGFQANSKIITVSDEMLSELVNMKR